MEEGEEEEGGNMEEGDDEGEDRVYKEESERLVVGKIEDEGGELGNREEGGGGEAKDKEEAADK